MTETLAHYAALAEGAKELEPYIAALRRHDWEYDQAEDHRAWRKGSDERRELLGMQRTLDPDRAIWNRYAPPAHRVA